MDNLELITNKIFNFNFVKYYLVEIEFWDGDKSYYNQRTQWNDEEVGLKFKSKERAQKIVDREEIKGYGWYSPTTIIKRVVTRWGFTDDLGFILK